MARRKPNSGYVPAKVPTLSLDFRSSDDAWYGVRLAVQKETLTVMYCDFSSEFDERFNAADFKSPKELEDFKQRFRPTSLQLQDRECSKVIEAMMVCVAYKFGENDIRFYDAIVDAVCYVEHKYVNGEEECSCIFKVFWHHGPNAGTVTSTGIGSICQIQSGDAEINSTLASFLKISREKLAMASHNSGFIFKSDVPPVCKGATDESQCKQSVTNCNTQETKSSKKSSFTERTFKVGISKRRERIWEDVDLGGETSPMKIIEENGDYHFIMIENMEKDLNPLAIVDFIYKQTSILPQAYVFPSLLSEPYTRGTIVVDSQEKLEKIYDFLHDPAHIIMSSRGRPWVMTENVSRRGTFRTTFGGLMPKSEKRPRNIIAEVDNIKVVRCGTEEYKKGEQLRESFMIFADHLKGLHKSLASRERRILQSSLTV